MPADLNSILDASDSESESVSDMDNLTDQEQAEVDLASDETEVEEMETEVPPKKPASVKKTPSSTKPVTAKASSASKPSPAVKKAAAAEAAESPKVARKRKAGDPPAEKKTKTKPPAKPTTEKRTDSPASKPAAAPAAVTTIKKPSSLRQCPGTLTIEYRTTQGSVVKVSGSGDNAVSACFAASIIAYGGRREMARRTTLQSASAIINVPQNGVELPREIPLFDFKMAISSFTLEALFQLAYELYSSQYKCDPL